MVMKDRGRQKQDSPAARAQGTLDVCCPVLIYSVVSYFCFWVYSACPHEEYTRHEVPVNGLSAEVLSQTHGPVDMPLAYQYRWRGQHC